MDLALAQLQGNIVIGDDTGKPLGNVQHLHCVIFQFSIPPYLPGKSASDGYILAVYHGIRWNAKYFSFFFAEYRKSRCITQRLSGINRYKTAKKTM
jgi:hypothetical protein